MGKKMAAAAALPMNSVMNSATAHTAASITSGSVPQSPSSSPATSAATPVLSIAVPRQMEPAKTMSTFQLMLSCACFTLQQRQSSVAAAARKAACSRVSSPSVVRAIIPSMMKPEAAVRQPTEDLLRRVT